MARFGGDAPDADDVGERHPVLRALKRLRSLIVLVPLVAVVVVAAGIGASKLWAELPEDAAVSPEVTCWNGSTATLEECPEPRGRAGLRWVFPSFTPGDSRCSEVRRRARDEARPLEFACQSSFDQRPLTITYSARTSLEQGLAFIERSSGVEGEPDADGERLVFRSPRADDDGLFRVTVAYAEHPYSVTVAAPTADVRDTALDELVRFRPADGLLTRT